MIRGADPNSADFGRPILLDEINRAKPGTLQKLYEFFAMLSDPKVEQFQVVGGENRPFTFRRSDLPVSYRMNFTGNPSTRAIRPWPWARLKIDALLYLRSTATLKRPSIGAGIGSAVERRPIIAAGRQQTFDIHVPEGSRNRRGNVEIYDRARYCTFPRRRYHAGRLAARGIAREVCPILQ